MRNANILPSSDEVCWCGTRTLGHTAHSDYLACTVCGTACLRSILATGQDAVEDEESHLYGENYWDAHQAALGLPPLKERARNDLPERCVYWLKHLLQYRLPPARVLEIGCSHGGFVKLLTSAGFSASGMEMSPQIIRRANEWFGVNVLQGPINAVSQPLGSFDVIVMFDVLEHLADPITTMKEITDHLSPDGLLVIQTPLFTPDYPRDWQMFVVPEHTFLFSDKGLHELLHRLGLSNLEQVPPIFQYDTFVFASRQPLRHHSKEEIEASLAATPDGRIVQALLDLDTQQKLNSTSDVARKYGAKRLAVATVVALGQWVRRLVRR